MAAGGGHFFILAVRNNQKKLRKFMRDEDKSEKNRVLTIQEVSRLLKIPVSSLYELTKKGKIKGVKFGKHWRYLERDITDYFSGHSRPALPPERRLHPRINCEVSVRLSAVLKREKNSDLTATLQNLSLKGLHLADSACLDLQIGDPVKVIFEIDSSALEIEGRVVHCVGRGAGIKFRKITSGAEGVLRDYVG